LTFPFLLTEQTVSRSEEVYPGCCFVCLE